MITPWPKWYTPPHIRKRVKRSGTAVINAVMQEFDIDKEKLISNGRRQKQVRARQVAWYVMSQNCAHLSYIQMAKLLNRVDHSTVIHGVKIVEELIARDNDFAKAVERVEMSLRD